VLSFLLFVVCLRVCTPMLQTLTSSYRWGCFAVLLRWSIGLCLTMFGNRSSDTIYALTILLSAVHIVWHDYQFVNNETPRYVCETVMLRQDEG